jgi:hypothetical protein
MSRAIQFSGQIEKRIIKATDGRYDDNCAGGHVTIIPFMPNGWAASGGGFPAMTGNVPFLMKDLVLLAVAIYLLRAGHTKNIDRHRLW